MKPACTKSTLGFECRDDIPRRARKQRKCSYIGREVYDLQAQMSRPWALPTCKSTEHSQICARDSLLLFTLEKMAALLKLKRVCHTGGSKSGRRIVYGNDCSQATSSEDKLSTHVHREADPKYLAKRTKAWQMNN